MNLVGARRILFVQPSALPGFGLTFGLTVAYLGLIVLLPLAALIFKPWAEGWQHIAAVLTDPRVLASIRLSFATAFAAAVINAAFGFALAWILVRFEFPGRRLLDALIDLPFALPTAVAGISLTALYAPNGLLGQPLSDLGIKAAFTPLGILIALIFIGLPFVVRSVQPVLQDFERQAEEAAATLGATPFQIFLRVVFPAVLPALLTGFALAFARGVGEYGSVIFIAGNIPMVSEIAPLLIVTKLEQYDYAGAATIGVVMLLISFVCLLAINLLQAKAKLR